MHTARELRTYQTDAVNSVLSTWGSDIRKTGVALPTGTGKSTVIAAVAAASARLGLRVVMLAHRAELLDQMAATVATVDPSLAPVGIVRADTDESDAQIVAASLQTLTNPKRHARIGARQVVLWDEVHHGGAVSWRKVLDDFGNPFFCGFTATMRRDDGKALREIIDTIAFERNLRWAIDEGHLVRPHGLTVKIEGLDLDSVTVTAGDFQQGELAEVMEAETPEICKAILMHCRDRRPIIFAASVQGAHDIAALLASEGMEAEAITGAMAYEDRQPIYERFRSAETQALVTVQVLTEGADFPMCDAVVIARPTRSQNLYSQMVGRALRLWPDKTDALVLDLVGTSRVLKLVTLSNLDAGTTSKTVDEDGVELPPEDNEEIASLEVVEMAGRVKRLGPISTVKIDLLAEESTSVLWLATRGGVPFVQPQGADFAVFLWETAPEVYRVGYMSTRGRKSGGWVEERPWPAAAAVSIAEDYVLDQGHELPSRRASWRRNAPPSMAQMKFAESLGIEGWAGMGKARLSDELSIKLMSDRLDTR